MFGELEFWFALIKVAALVGFLLVGIYFVIFGTPVDGQEVGFSLITDNGGMLPNGLLPAIVVMQGVVFAYASIELIGTAAGETQNPEKIMPKAINTVVVRIAGVLRRLGPAAEPAAALHLLPGRRQPVRDVLRLHRLRRRGRHHEHRGPHGGAVLAERRPVLHRPHPAFDVDGRFRAEVRRPDEQGRCPLRRHRPDRRSSPLLGVGPERRGARPRPSRSC